MPEKHIEESSVMKGVVDISTLRRIRPAVFYGFSAPFALFFLKVNFLTLKHTEFENMPQKFFIFLLFILSSPAVHAASSGICGATAEACSYTLDDNGKLTITGNGDMALNTGYYPPWGTDIKEVSISGITSIATHAFVQSKLENIEIPDSVTYIGAYVFENTWQLSSITLPSSLTTLHEGSFTGTNIQNLILPDSLFEDGSFFSPLALNGSKITNLICSASRQSACEQYLQNAEEYYWPDEIPAEERTWPPMRRPLSNRDQISVSTYTVDGAGNIVYKNKTYASFNDFSSGKHIPKRIYTVEEANNASGKKNSVILRYK